MIYVGPESYPPYFAIMIGRLLIRLGLGWVPLAPANKGKASTPDKEARFFEDPQTYHGWIRIATGFQILDGMNHIHENYKNFKMPVLLVHGKKDRVCEWKGSEEFYALCGSKDKELIFYDEMQHDIMREDDVAK